MSVPLVVPALAYELASVLKYQLEWYFSPENLANDRYLVSQVPHSLFTSLFDPMRWKCPSLLCITVIWDPVLSIVWCVVTNNKCDKRPNITLYMFLHPNTEDKHVESRQGHFVSFVKNKEEVHMHIYNIQK